MKRSSNKKGFTLIELLAVIIILGVLLLIAIPSVTEYISNSRKKTYLATAGKYVDAVINKVNALDYNFNDKNTMYYVPYNCIELEKGGKSPYGEWIEAYVVVTFNGDSYSYYWTSVDDSEMGIPLTLSKDLDPEKITGGMTSIDKEVTVGGRVKRGEIPVTCGATPTISDIAGGGTPTTSTYTITFDCNEVECTVSPKEKEVENGSTYGELPEAVRIGYTFLGWYNEKEEGEWIKIYTTVELTTDQTLYAQWQANTYTVSYDCNGISCSIGTETVTYGSTYGTLATPPTREGYTFEGWYTATTGGSKIESTTNVTVTSNQTLYAQWKVVLPKLADVVSIGDYVNYDAGTWAETKGSPNMFAFGGYTVGSSRNSSVTCESGWGTPANSGWRVLSKNSTTGEVKLIHAGQPECYYHPNLTDSRGNSERIMSGSTSYAINGSYTSTPRNWSMYVNSTFAVSATAFTKTMLDSWNGSSISYGTTITNDLIKTNASYWLGSAYPNNTSTLDYVTGGGYVGNLYIHWFGVRPVITMKLNITTTGKVGNVWQLQ